jgi:hypothetical protein
MPALIGACLALAGFALLLPSEPSYDPLGLARLGDASWPGSSSPERLLTGRVRLAGRARGRLPIASVGGWSAYRRVGLPPRRLELVRWPAFTGSLQGFHIRGSGAGTGRVG